MPKIHDILEILKTSAVTKVLMVLLVLMIGWLISRFLSRALGKYASKHFALHQVMLMKRMSYYLLMALTVVTALNEAGINLSVVVGAAGVASVAIGFASQTSMSNLISGIFIVIEKPFIVGDTVRIGGTTGEVISMGLLSTILRTADNVMVRLPNETLMKSEIANVTRFATRKFDLAIGVDYTANLTEVKALLIQTALSLEIVLKEPSPGVAFERFGESSLDVLLSCWVRQERLAEAKFEVAQAVKQALDAANIGIPYPQRTLTVAPNQGLRVELTQLT